MKDLVQDASINYKSLVYFSAIQTKVVSVTSNNLLLAINKLAD
jgi:hypothetical protein